MSFDVFLIGSSASPIGAPARAAIDGALAACGARRGRDGECDFVLASGADQEFFGEDDEEPGGMFAMRGLSPELVQLIFAIADATRCFIIFPGSEPVALRTPSNTGALVGGEDMPTAAVANPRHLAQHMGASFDDWAGYAEAVVSGPSHDDDDDVEIDPTLLDRFFKPSKQD